MSINEAINIQTTSINAIAPTTGSLSIGDSQTTGVLNLGTNAGRTGNVNIANQASNSCAINIMNGGAGTSGSVNIANVGANSTGINIGSTTGTGVVSLQSASSVKLSELKVVGNFLNNATDEYGGAIYIAGKQTSGVLWIGAGDQSRTNAGAINIGGGSCPINIMTRPGFGLGGSVNIANGDGASQTTAVNIGNGSTTGTVTIGNTANTVQVNGALAMGTGRNITLQPTASYVAPTANTMLGGTTAGSFLTPSSAFSASKDIATISLEKGTYLIYFSFNANYTVLPTAKYVIIRNTGTALPRPATEYGGVIIQTGTLGFNAFFPLSVTTAGTQILNYQIIGTINSITSATYSAVRIA